VSATASWTALGTTATVLVTDPAALSVARNRVAEELRAVDVACSRFRDDSELVALNAGAGSPREVGPLLSEAIAIALRAAAITDGAVDPTIGEALVLAGYDRDFADLGPDVRRRVRASRVRGWQTVHLDESRRLVTLPRGVRLDLGATAKALAADRSAAAAAAACPGVGVLVSLGGDIATAGPAPGPGWRVRVTDDHRAPVDAPDQVVAIRSGGLATSGTTARRWGEGLHHIIDPSSGQPARGPWRTASVAAASCVDANTASTAAIVRGAPAEAWLVERALPARLVDHLGRVRAVAGWPRETPAS
jgi:thiamine biosynthesis lipoprotein